MNIHGQRGKKVLPILHLSPASCYARGGECLNTSDWNLVASVFAALTHPTHLRAERESAISHALETRTKFVEDSMLLVFIR